jgi:serine/threonine protein kinase
MTSSRWKRIDELFLAACDKPNVERESYLVDACGNDQELLIAVRDLLDGDCSAPPGFLNTPEPHTHSALPIDDDLLIGERIGQYTVTRLIAAGGMGRVYEARQDQPSRLVAIKLIRPAFAGPLLLRRFDLESQILARLQHPGIAQIFDAGIFNDGNVQMPYFAMEHIPDARSITQFSEHRNLDTRAQLGLFMQACCAVNYGHQKGIIHRDLKPENILVDVLGHVKIIDFGIARVTDSDVAVTTMKTDAGQLLGTIQYMSPEQYAADPPDLDIRSDVYALGVILYEIVCRRLPYDVSGMTIAHAARVVCEEAPSRPMLGRSTLHRDLELVLLKALKKDREQRYGSAEALGRDIEHYLSGDPIDAKAPTKWTRVMGWLRRHPIATTTLLAGFVALGIVGGSVAAVEYARRTPLRVELGHQQVRLIALNGEFLHAWNPTPPSVWIYGKNMAAILEGRKTKLALILYDALDGGTHPGELCAYNLEKREYDSPLWCDRVHNDDLPSDPFRTLRESEFSPHHVWFQDIYPEIEGKEILVDFAHDFSRRAIRVYSAEGDRLHQTWHDGALAAVRFLKIPKLLVVTAIHDAHPWRDRGYPDLWGAATFGKPLVVFAFEPKRGDWNRSYICTDGETRCVEPEWYKCLLPAEEAIRVSKMVFVQPPPRLSNGGHVGIRLEFTTIENYPIAQAGWTIDQFGNQVEDVYYKGDKYLLQEDKLPPIESFYLGPLPPIVKP